MNELLESLKVAMLGTTDGGFVEPESEIPAGEMYRLAAEWVEANVRDPSQWEYGVMFPEFRSDASFVGVEDSARYFMSRPASAVDKHATDSDKRILVRRVKAGPWIAVAA